MSCDPVINYFFPTTMDFFTGTVLGDTPFRVEVRNAGTTPGTIVVDFDGAPALTDQDEDTWRPVGSLPFPNVASMPPPPAGTVPGGIPGDAGLALGVGDVLLRAAARGNPPGVPLADASQTIFVVVV